VIANPRPYPAYKDSGVEWLGEIPEGWNVLLSRRFCRIFAGATPSRDEPTYWNQGQIPWLASGDVNRRRISAASQFITDAGFQASSTKWIRPGSIVIALAGQGKTKGMAALVDLPATCNQSLGVLEPSLSLCNPEFLLYYFESRYRDIRG
jgi:type I restriction enzyme S subunit